METALILILGVIIGMIAGIMIAFTSLDNAESINVYSNKGLEVSCIVKVQKQNDGILTIVCED